MKIYQVHRIGGVYEDSYDYIVGTYLNKGKAEKFREHIIKENEKEYKKYKRCSKCPIWGLTKRKYNNKPNILSDYCNHSDVEFDGNEIDCKNMTHSYWDSYEERVEIEEVEVIE